MLVKWNWFGKQKIEAIIVISKFERLDEYFSLQRNGSGEMAKFGDINAYVDHEVVHHFKKSDTVISTNNYHRRLD